MSSGTVYPLLKTKLYVPPVRSTIVERPRLIERLNGGLWQKLTLLSAPAGFGKTTLLSNWAHHCRDAQVAWLSLDENDNDAGRFWAYLIAALQPLRSSVGTTTQNLLQSTQPVPAEIFLTSLINEIVTGSKRQDECLILVLDDFHWIETRSIVEGIHFLLNHLPAQMHVVIASRSDPQLPLGRLRGRGELNELRAADLRFTLEEAIVFLNQAMSLNLSLDTVAALETRTEGWAVGLQLVALSIHGHGLHHAAQLAASLSGNQRYILDYLLEEVLVDQPQDVQDFLLQTSILNRLTGPLCDVVTGQTNSQRLLEQLDRRNLFILSLDTDRRWYRYYRLFADLLQSRLAQEHPEWVTGLHQRASQWYEQQGQYAEAVAHALAADDLPQALRLIETHALSVAYHGELDTVVKWLEAVPLELVHSRPWLCLAHAWVLAMTGRLEEATHCLQGAEELISNPSTASVVVDDERQRFLGHIAVVHAYILGLKGDGLAAAECARQALERLPEWDWMARREVATILGSSLRWQGDFVAAADALNQAVAISQAVGVQHTAIDILSDLALVQITQGELHRAVETCRNGLQLAEDYLKEGGQRLPATGYLQARMSQTLYEWNNLEGALRLAREGVELSKEWGQADFLVIGYFELARVLQVTGDPDGALAALHSARQAGAHLSSWYRVAIGAYEAGIRLMQGDLRGAARWLEESGLQASDPMTIQYGFVYRTAAQVLIAQGRLDEAWLLLQRLMAVVKPAGAVMYIIHVLVLQALVLQARGQLDAALEFFEQALVMAEEEGYVRTFVDEGAPMVDLLRRALARGVSTNYVTRLLAAFSESLPSALPASVQPVLIESLSEREVQVLRLVANGLANKEIAQSLVITVGTVKNHLKNIYGKLDAHNRTEAVAIARQLGLL